MELENGQIVLEEAYDGTYEPTEEEILQFCEVIGLDPNTEKDLMYLAKEGTRAQLPPGWKPVEDTVSGRIYYYNFRTKERTWDHPCDDVYRQLLAEERKKRGRMEGGITPSTGSKKKGSKKTGKTSAGAETTMSAAMPGPLNPLPSGGRLAPLGPVRGLPPLKSVPHKPGGLAPLQPRLGMAPGVKGTTHAPTPAPISTPQSATFNITQPPTLPAASTSRSLNPLQGGIGRGDMGVLRGLGDVGSSSKRDLGAAELGGNLQISTQFVEEEDDEESSSGSHRGFRLGQNLLDNRDLGIPAESQEELHSSEAIDSSEELRRMLESDGEEAEDGIDGERPLAPLGQRPMNTSFSPTHQAPLSPILSPPIPSTLSPLPTAPHQPPQAQALPTHTTNPRTDPQYTTTSVGAPPTMSSVVTTANTRGLSTTMSPSITPPPGIKMATILATTTPGFPPSDRDVPPSTTSFAAGVNVTSSNIGAKSTAKVDERSTTSVPIPNSTIAGLTNGAPRFTVAQMKPTEGGKITLAHAQEDVRGAEEQNKQELEKIRKEHEAAVNKLKEQLSAEFEREKETIQTEGRDEVERVKKDKDDEVESVRKEELERVRRSVEEEHAKQERELRDRKLKNMSELKKTLKEEEEEEEARLAEEKDDNLRIVRQKIASEKEKEEAKLRQEAARSRQELIEQLATEKREEEARLRSVASKEMSETRAGLEKETEAEREEVKKELQRQLQVFKEEQEDKHNKEKAEIEENFREQLEALKHEEQLKVQAELERKQAAEEEREKAVQKQQQDIAALQQELAGELEEKRSELQEQHHATLETLKMELEAALSSVKSEHQKKVEEERKRMQSEFESISATLRKEHEERVEQLKRELAASEEQYKKQTQIQSEKLRELQSDYDRKCSELQQLQQELEEQSEQAERQKRRPEDRARLNPREHSRIRGHGVKRENPLLTVMDDPTCFSEHGQAVSPSLPLSNSQAATREEHYDRVKSGPPDSRERVKERSHDPKSGDDWSETSGSVGSMQLEDLAPPTSPLQARANLERVRIMLEQNQRTLLRVLAEEQSFAAGEHEAAQMGAGKKEKDGELVRGDQRSTRERGRRERCKPQKRPSTKPPKGERSQHQAGNIKSKLKEEVRALGELERKLHSSRQLLVSREQDLHNLHSHLSEDLPSDNGEVGRVERELSPRPFLPATERRELVPETRDSDRTPTRARRTSSIPRTPLTRPPLKQYTASRSTAGSEGDDGRGSRRERRGRREDEATHQTRRTRGRGWDTREPVFEPNHSHSQSEGETSVSSGSKTESPTPSENVSSMQDGQLESQREMVKSLNSINRQLRQLTSHIRQGSPHPPRLPPQQASSPHPTTPPYIPTARWAEPVMQGRIPTPYLQPQQRRESRESTRAQPTPSTRHPSRHRKSGGGYVTTSPTHMYPGEGVFRADWLHEFQTQFPYRHLSPRPQRVSAPFGPYTVPHAQLVMDSDKNIHLVHM